MNKKSTSGYAFEFYSIRVILSILILGTLCLCTAGEVRAAGEGRPCPQALFIPLDDRPSTRLFPGQIARIGGGSLLQPPANAIGHAYKAGDPAACAQWLTEQTAKGQPRTVIASADMLAYGGLLASRTSVLSAEQAAQNLEVLRRIAPGTKQIRVFVTLPRLSLRTSDAQAPHETALANWARQASYGSLQFSKTVPEQFSQEYMAVRRRNLQVIDHLLALTQEGIIKQLVICADDNNKEGLSAEEQSQVKGKIESKELGAKVKLINGTDEIGMCLVSGWLAEYWNCHTALQVCYSDLPASAQVPKNESKPLYQTVSKHIELCGAYDVAGMSSEIVNSAALLWIETQSDKPYQAPAEEASAEDKARSAKLETSLRWAKANKRRIGVADVRLINRADPILAETILDDLDLWDLEGYAAWNTASNTIGTAIAQMAVHDIARSCGRTWDQARRLESEKTQLAFTWARLLDDYAYQALIRPTLSDMVKGLPRDPDPLLNKYGGAGMSARQKAIDWADTVWQKKLRGRCYTHPNFGTPLLLESYKLEAVLPWPRVFEIEARLDLRLRPLSAAEAKTYRQQRHTLDVQSQAEQEAAARAKKAAEAYKAGRDASRQQKDQEFKDAAKARSAQPNKPKDRDQSVGEAVTNLFKGGDPTQKKEEEASKKKKTNFFKDPGKAIKETVDAWTPTVKDVVPAVKRTVKSVEKTAAETERQ